MNLHTCTKKEISKRDAVDLINNTNGKVFAVKFIKKDGNYRIMNARLGVHKYLKGGINPLAKCNNPYLITVFDMNKKQYRTVNVETAIYINANLVSYIVKERTNHA